MRHIGSKTWRDVSFPVSLERCGSSTEKLPDDTIRVSQDSSGSSNDIFLAFRLALVNLATVEIMIFGAEFDQEG